MNQTGLAGKFDYEVEFEIDQDSLPGTQTLTRPLNDGSISALRRALEQQLALKLEATRSPVETLVIEQVEKPSENWSAYQQLCGQLCSVCGAFERTSLGPEH